MYINLNNLSKKSLYYLALLVIEEKYPEGPHRISGCNPENITWVMWFKDLLGYGFDLESNQSSTSETPEKSRIVITKPNNARFETDYLYKRSATTWWDLAEVFLAAWYGDFWVDLPDEICQKLNHRTDDHAHTTF